MKIDTEVSKEIKELKKRIMQLMENKTLTKTSKMNLENAIEHIEVCFLNP